MKKINIGIIGSAGYTGGELTRLLLNHPNANIKYLYSKSNANKYLYEIHEDLFQYKKVKFSSCYDDNVDIIFLCSGHGKSRLFLKQFKFKNNLKIIDLSQDFRNNPILQNEKSCNIKFTYGLPELNKQHIARSHYIANPGCFATLIQIALLPLIKKKILKYDINISAVTGSTGSGQSPSYTSHFSWRNNNLSIYKAFTHQHLDEIKNNSIVLYPNFKKNINFIPYRGNFSRGIFASLYFTCYEDIKYIINLYEKFYENHPFVYLSDININLKQVINTNICLLNINKYNNQILITGCIDNLIKGASGQAIQNMNLMFNIDEKSGLNIKSISY